MKNSFDKEEPLSKKMELDIERIKNELGKGVEIEEIADKLNLEREYVKFLFWFGIV